ASPRAAARPALAHCPRGARPRRSWGHDHGPRPARRWRERVPLRDVRTLALLRGGRTGMGDGPPSLVVVMADPARHDRGRLLVTLGAEIPAALPLGDRQPPRASRHGGAAGAGALSA